MRSIFLSVLVLISIKLFSQENNLILKGGVLKSYMEAQNFTAHNTRTYGTVVAFGFEHILKAKVSFTAEVYYNQRGYGYEYTFPSGTGYSFQGLTVLTKSKFNYLSFPLRIGFQNGRKGYGFAKVGAAPGILISANERYPFIDSYTFQGYRERDLKSEYTKGDLTFMFEIGGGYKFKQGFSVFGAVGYQTAIKRVTFIEIPSSKRLFNGANLMVGAKYNLKGKH